MVCINSSDIAKITGYNKYTKFDEYNELFIKNMYRNREDLKEYDEDNKCVEFISEQETIDNLIVNLQESDKKEVINILNTDHSTTEKLLKNSNNLTEIINTSNIPETEKQNIIHKLNTNINCKYGSVSEQVSIDKYQETTNHNVYDNNTKCYVKPFNNFKICGKIDGLVDKDGKTYIYEMKNRKNRIFTVIPMYEKIQLLSYTKLLGNSNIIFTQCHGEEQDTKILEDYKDDSLWDELIFRLTMYADTIYTFQSDENIRHKFLKSTEKQKYKILQEYLFYIK